MRLFVAVRPPATVIDALQSLPRPPLEGVRWTTPDQWHVTLRFLGEVDDAAPVVDALGAAGAPVEGPVEVVLGPTTARLGAGVLMVPAAGLDDVAGTVVAATAALGRPPEDRPFLGHLTLARRRRGSRTRLPAGEPVDLRFTARGVSLVRSHLHPHGARYEPLAEISFGGA